MRPAAGSRIAISAVMVVFCSHVASLQQTSPADLITEASIRGHMEFLASDAMRGRGSGTEDEWRAAVYIGSEMRQWGVEPLGDDGSFVRQIDTPRPGDVAGFVGHTWDAIGQLTGSDPAMSKDVILLTAHLDHLGVRDMGPGVDGIFNGADDDASGSVAVMELARAMAAGPRPKRTVIFAWFGSEENGGAGARDFLQHPPVPLTQIVANLEFEMIANRDSAVAPHTLWLTGYECSTLGPDLAKQGARIVADPHPEQAFFMRSDNIQLARVGIVAQTVSSFDVNRQPSTYHRPTDEISTVDFAHMTDAIQSMLAPALWLANSDETPAWLEGKDPSKGGTCGAR